MTTMILIMLAMLAILGLYFEVLCWVRNHLKHKFLITAKNKGCVCLTFDDGPNPASTPDLLDLLEELNIKATFFLVGQNVQKYPELCREILRHNHEVGDHGFRHVHPWTCLPFYAAIDLIRGHAEVKKHCPTNGPLWLRTPYGKLNLTTLGYVLLCRRRLAFWDIDPRDYLPQPPDKLATAVLNQFMGSSVILLHDKPPQADPINTNLSAIKIIVQEIKKQGYTFAKVSEAAGQWN
jgi:peptidoglycan/xylan/chitin deacetylase (PgdA/CDA1 family)